MHYILYKFSMSMIMQCCGTHWRCNGVGRKQCWDGTVMQQCSYSLFDVRKIAWCYPRRQTIFSQHPHIQFLRPQSADHNNVYLHDVQVRGTVSDAASSGCIHRTMHHLRLIIAYSTMCANANELFQCNMRNYDDIVKLIILTDDTHDA